MLEIYWHQWHSYDGSKWNRTTILSDGKTRGTTVDTEAARVRIERMGYATRLSTDLPTGKPTDDEKARVNKFTPGLL